MAKITFFKCVAVIAILVLTACRSEKSQVQNIEEEVFYEPAVVEEVFEDTTVIIETSILRGEGPFNVMERLNIDRGLRQRILNILADETDFTSLRVGTRFAGVFCLDTAKLLEFIYFQDKMTTHRVEVVHCDYEGNPQIPQLFYVLEERPSEVRYRLVRGTLNSPTLDAELRQMGLPSPVVGIATNVLQCRISFRTDARKGDEFEVLLRETVFADTIDGEIVERTLDNRTAVLLVSYSGARAGTHRGFRFFHSEGSSYNAHYTEDGQALISSGLRYPLDRMHITSRFGMRRHPVTGRNTMHGGVDLRASVGTPVYAIAEGRVVKSRFCNTNGNYIAIRHRDNSTSYYLHLSRRNVQVGANVRSRQVIGLTGNTGLSTGPHLCFRIRNPNGQWVNPLQRRMIATPRLQGEKLASLHEQIAEIKGIYEEQLALWNLEQEQASKQLAQNQTSETENLQKN